MTEADRVAHWHLHPLFEGAADREIARVAKVAPEVVADVRTKVDADRASAHALADADRLVAYGATDLLRALEHADTVRGLVGYDLDLVSFINDVMISAAFRHHSRAAKARVVASATDTRLPATERRHEADKSGNQDFAGSRPARQPRRASAPEGADGGPPRGDHGSYDEGRRGDR